MFAKRLAVLVASVMLFPVVANGQTEDELLPPVAVKYVDTNGFNFWTDYYNENEAIQVDVLTRNGSLGLMYVSIFVDPGRATPSITNIGRVTITSSVPTTHHPIWVYLSA